MDTTLRDLTIELTKKCPNKCLFCSSNSDCTKTEKLEVDIIYEIIRQAFELKVQNIMLSGGEPLCHPDIFDVVCEASRIMRGSNIYFYTTGMLGWGEKGFVNWDIFSDLNIVLVFNIQSLNWNIHNKLVGVATFWNTYNSMMAARDMGFDCGANIIPNKINIKGLKNTIEQLIRRGICRINLLRFVAQARGANCEKDLRLNVDEEKELYDVIDEFKNDPRLKVFKYGKPFSRGEDVCHAGTGKLVVKPNGEIVPCEAMKNNDKMDKIFFGGEYDLKKAIEFYKSNKVLSDMKLNVVDGETCIVVGGCSEI